MDKKIKVKVILGSVRSVRFGERPANWINEGIKAWKDIDAELLDLKDYPLPLFDLPTSPSMMGKKYPNEVAQAWSDKINEADAYIIVSAEYNHGYPGALKNAIDWLFPEWGRKPVGFVSYGSAGGARAIEQLREVAIEMNMVPIRKSIHIGWEFIVKSMSGNGISDTELFAPLRNGMGTDHLAALVDDLLWMAKALKAARGIES